jgi:hypothetical protein
MKEKTKKQTKKPKFGQNVGIRNRSEQKTAKKGD